MFVKHGHFFCLCIFRLLPSLNLSCLIFLDLSQTYLRALPFILLSQTYLRALPFIYWIFQSLKDPILRLVTSQKKTRKKKNRYLTQGKVPYEIFGVFNLLTTLGISKLKGPHSRTFSYRFVILFLLYPVDTCQLSKGKVFVNSSAAGALCQVTPSKPGNITEPGVTHNMVEPPVLPTT